MDKHIFPNHEVIITDDGSPSLVGENESMHNRGGAYTETQYIYGECLRKQGETPMGVVVVGLGLGYCELLAACEAIKQNKGLRLLSFEADQVLLQSFLHWLEHKPQNANAVYDKILDFYRADGYLADQARQLLAESYKNGLWKILGRLDAKCLQQKKQGGSNAYQYILFDAYSSKTSPELWSEEFLTQFFEQFSDSDFCSFSSYAATGNLSRALRQSQFVVQKIKGFNRKKESTQALKLRPLNER